MSIPPTAIQCNLCQQSFGRKWSLKRHIHGVHIKIREYSCSNCNQLFPTKRLLFLHNQQHHTIKRFKCPHCHNLCCQLNNHIEKCDETPCQKIDATFKCSMCTQSFSKNLFKSHMLEEHHMFVCDLCHQPFHRKCNLKRHISCYHYKIKPFTCDECNQSFGEKSHLSRHIQIVHQNLKKFECAVCDRLFGQKHNLQRHLFYVHHCNVTYETEENDVVNSDNCV